MENKMELEKELSERVSKLLKEREDAYVLLAEAKKEMDSRYREVQDFSISSSKVEAFLTYGKAKKSEIKGIEKSIRHLDDKLRAIIAQQELDQKNLTKK